MIRYTLALIAALAVCSATAARASERNPKSYVATTMGDNELLAAAPGKAYTIHALAVLPTSDTPVSFYLHNDDNDLLGSASHGVMIPWPGVGGPAGFVLPYNPGGWMATDAAGEAVKINLSAATPVVVLVVYSLQ